jgi:hypothetical protein
MKFARLASAAAALPAVIALAIATPALAGQYVVYGCRTPEGAVAPTSGWSPSSIGSWVTYSNDCAAGGGLQVEMDPSTTHANHDEAKWYFAAPPNTRIVAFAGHRASQLGNGQAYGVPGQILGEAGGYLETCYRSWGCPGNGSFAGWAAQGNGFAFNGLDTSSLYIVVLCGGGDGGTCPAEHPSAIAVLYRSEITIADALDPQPSTPSGALAQAGVHAGTEAITFNVTDQGSGVYRAVVEVDGVAVDDEIVDGNGGRCTDAQPGDGNRYEFLDRQPCKLAANTTLAVDTTHLADGDHTLRVSVVDASGNKATVLGPSPFRVGNGGASRDRGALNGANATDAARLTASFEHNRSSGLVVRFDQSALVRGRLVDDADRGIGHARLDISSIAAAPGSKEVIGPGATTAPDGSFSVRLPPRMASRRIRVGYRSHVGDGAAAASTDLRLKVKAAIDLAISPRVVANRHAITFRGRLLGRPIPRSGKLLEVQVRFPSGWRTFATVRAGRTGSFKYRYRFLRSSRPVTYVFRIRSRRESAYPYETSTSRERSVRIRNR